MTSTPRETVENQPQQNEVPPDKYRDAEAQLGGADNVEKTTYVVGKGTDPNARRGEGPAATVSSRGAPMIALVVVLVLVVLVALAYIVGIVRS